MQCPHHVDMAHSPHLHLALCSPLAPTTSLQVETRARRSQRTPKSWASTSPTYQTHLGALQVRIEPSAPAFVCTRRGFRHQLADDRTSAAGFCEVAGRLHPIFEAPAVSVLMRARRCSPLHVVRNHRQSDSAIAMTLPPRMVHAAGWRRMFDAAAVKVVGDPIGRAAIPSCEMEQIHRLAHCEVRRTLGIYVSRRA